MDPEESDEDLDVTTVFDKGSAATWTVGELSLWVVSSITDGTCEVLEEGMNMDFGVT